MDLFENPFHVLKATLRDNRRRLSELADEHSLLQDARACMDARSDLTNPKKRITAEVAWLLGISPKRAGEALSLLLHSPADLLAVDNLPSIARANLLVAALARLNKLSPEEIAKWILAIAGAFEEITLGSLNTLINEDRIVARFPEVTDLDAVEAGTRDQQRHYRKVIQSALNNLSTSKQAQAVTIAAETATDTGEEQGPVLIVDLVADYELEVQKALEKEEGKIEGLLQKLWSAVRAERPDSVLTPLVDRLIRRVKGWDVLAQPIQVSAKSRGLDHEASQEIAMKVRKLAFYMCNQPGKIELAQQLNCMMREVFAEVVDIAELADKDARTLNRIAKGQKASRP